MNEYLLNPVRREGSISPRFHSVVLHNDDYTTFDFVVTVLVDVCGLTVEQAFTVALTVDEVGKGCAGIYTQDIAMTKQLLILKAAEQQGHPLRVTVEPE